MFTILNRIAIFTLVTVISAPLSILCCSCVSQASEDTSDLKTVSEHLRSELMGIDYSQEIDLSSSFDELGAAGENLSDFSLMYLEQMNSRIGNEIPSRELSAAEKNRLGLWRFPDGSATLWQMTFGKVRRSYACNCEMPESGLDLIPDLLTQTGYDEFSGMSRAEQLRKYRDIIDPITGHFYSSFIAETWEPGAMYIQVITDPAVIEERYPHRKVGSLEYNQETGKFQDGPRKPVSEIWKIRIYGEEPGTILYEGESCY